MKLLLLTISIVALCVLLLCFNILRHKEFPQYDVGGNARLRERGIRCFKEEDAALHAGCPGGGQSGSQPGASGKGQPVDCGQGEACEGCEFKQAKL
jgi:hypothetical protein